jgi:DNA modification methylase
MKVNHIFQGDALQELKKLPDQSVDCIITSPPYFQVRDYRHADQIGHEKNFDDYIENLRVVFLEAKRVLKDTGTLWLNIGDTYSGSGGGDKGQNGKEMVKDYTFRKRLVTALPEKSLINIPARLSIALQNDGWVLRNEIIWHKPNAMPSSVKDRFTIDFEKLFFFTKFPHGYYFAQQKEPMETPISLNTIKRENSIKNENSVSNKQDGTGNRQYTGLNARYQHPNDLMRNKRTTWEIPTEKRPFAHFATFPDELVETCIEAGCPDSGIVLDMFMGSGTTAIVAKSLGRQYIGIELNPEYVKLANKRLTTVQMSIFSVY